MEITSQADGLVTIVRISGRIDFATSESLEQVVCAIIAGGKGTAKEKVAALEAAGVAVAATPADMAATLQKLLK